VRRRPDFSTHTRDRDRKENKIIDNLTKVSEYNRQVQIGQLNRIVAIIYLFPYDLSTKKTARSRQVKEFLVGNGHLKKARILKRKPFLLSRV
jgi:hypothetical protein